MLKITKNQGSIQVTADKSGFYPFDGTITFPTNSLFTATSANTDMITFKSTSNGDVQFVGNYKDITISGRSYDTKQKFLTAFSNLANQGSVDAYTKAETDAKIDAKQNKLKAGNGITLTEDATDSTTVVKTAVSLTDNGEGAYQVGDSIEIDPYDTVRIGRNTSSGSGTRGSVVMGSDASITGICNVAVGDQAAGNNSSIAVGYRATTIGDNSTAIGYEAKAIQTNTIAVGTGSVSDGDGSIAIGNASSTANYDSIAIGNASSVYGENSIAIGSNANNIGSDCISIGYYSHAGETNDAGSVVIGSNANGYSGTTSTLIGFGANSHGFGCTGIGPTATVNETTPLAITAGYKTVGDNKQMLTMIQGDANGKISLLKGDGTDERIVIQDEIEALKNAGGSGGTVDAYTKAETDTKLDAKQDKLTAGSGITITKDETAGTSTIATAVSLKYNGNGAYQVGDSIKMEREGLAIGMNASGRGSSLVAIGNNANGYGNESVAIGNNTSVDGSENVVIGTYASSISHNGVAIGYNSRTNSNNSVAIGYSSRADENTPLVIRAGYKTVGSEEQPLTVLQSDSTGKLSILKGDGSDERIVIQDALSAGGSGGTVDAYTKAETDNLLNAKQNTLTAGTGITIDENNVISSTGGSGGSANPLVNVKGTGSATITDTVTDAVAIGSGAKVTEDKAVAIGPSADAGPAFPLVIRAGADTNGNALPMIQGYYNGKILIPLGDGTAATMVIQDEIEALKNAGGSANPLVNVKGTGSDATITDSVTDGVAIGSGAKVSKDYGVSVGYQCKSGDNSVAIGKSCSANGGYAIAIGNGANIGTFANNTIAVGTGAKANVSYSLAIGKNATTSADTPMVINAGDKTMIQSDINGKISLLKGDGSNERIVIQDEIAALKAEIAALKAGTSTGA